jgi:hypothetical protein
VKHDAPDLPAQTLAVGALEALERPAVDRDLVRQDAGVPASALRQWDALVETEQRLAGRWLCLDDDRDIEMMSRSSLGTDANASSTSRWKSISPVPSSAAIDLARA